VTSGSRSGTPAIRPELFSRQARAALEKHLPETHSATAHWRIGANKAWVRLRRPDGLYGYFALRRHLDWVTGETGLSRAPCELADLFRLPGTPTREVPGFRIRLGDLLHGEDRWWPAGESEGELVERLEYLALQFAVKGVAYFRRWPGGEG
jgi:hypothetical protein